MTHVNCAIHLSRQQSICSCVSLNSIACYNSTDNTTGIISHRNLSEQRSRSYFDRVKVLYSPFHQITHISDSKKRDKLCAEWLSNLVMSSPVTIPCPSLFSSHTLGNDPWQTMSINNENNTWNKFFWQKDIVLLYCQWLSAVMWCQREKRLALSFKEYSSELVLKQQWQWKHTLKKNITSCF